MKKDYPDIQALENEKWQDPDPATGKLGTRVPAKWLQLVEDSSKSLTLEILEVLKEAKIEPNELKNTQLKDAIVAIAAVRIINWKDVQNAPKILDVLGDSKIDGASQRVVNTVNKLAKEAQTAANLANDKANQAKQEAYTADQKATAAQNTANSVNDKLDSKRDSTDNIFSNENYAHLALESTGVAGVGRRIFLENSSGSLTFIRRVGAGSEPNQTVVTLPNKSGTLALTSDFPSLSGYATQAWANANSTKLGAEQSVSRGSAGVPWADRAIQALSAVPGNSVVTRTAEDGASFRAYYRPITRL